VCLPRDREEIDILGAHRAGMHGLLIGKKNLARLQAQVEKGCGRRVS